MILHILPENGRKRGCSRPWHVFHPVVFVGPHFVWLKLSQWRLLLVQMCSELVVVLLAENLFPGSKTSKQIRTQDGWQNAARNLRITCSAASATWARFPKLTIQCAHYQHICIGLDMFMWCPRQLWGKGTQFNTSNSSNSSTCVSMSFTGTTLTWIVYMGCLSTSSGTVVVPQRLNVHCFKLLRVRTREKTVYTGSTCKKGAEGHLANPNQVLAPANSA